MVGLGISFLPSTVWIQTPRNLCYGQETFHHLCKRQGSFQVRFQSSAKGFLGSLRKPGSQFHMQKPHGFNGNLELLFGFRPQILVREKFLFWFKRWKQIVKLLAIGWWLLFFLIPLPSFEKQENNLFEVPLPLIFTWNVCVLLSPTTHQPSTNHATTCSGNGSKAARHGAAALEVAFWQRF